MDKQGQTMLSTVPAVVRRGQIELLESVNIPEGTRMLVTLLEDDDVQFWQNISQVSLDAIWNNDEDDVYAELLQK